jgi:putative colanic acid biosynthesis glycosyltransferase
MDTSMAPEVEGDGRTGRPLISVITVVYNNRQGFRETAQSVIEQEDADAEWVVIDGGSTDGTVEEIAKVRHAIASWCSERDRGIYDAMNKGIARARGEFLVFMNSGDRFAGRDTLKRVSQVIAAADPDIGMVLGAARFELSPSFSYVQSPRPLDRYIRHSLPTSHQAMFFRTDLHRRALFDPSIRIAADYDAICRMYLINPKAAYLPDVVARVWRGLESNSIRHPMKNILDMARTQRRVFRMGYLPLTASMVKRSLPVLAFRLMSFGMSEAMTRRVISALRPEPRQPSPLPAVTTARDRNDTGAC